MKKKPTLNPTDRTRKAKRRYFGAVLTCVLACAVCTPAFAAGEDPLTAINNLSTFVFSAIKAIGVILLGWGVVQIGLSLQSHDPSQHRLSDLFRRSGHRVRKGNPRPDFEVNCMNYNSRLFSVKQAAVLFGGDIFGR